MVKKPSQLNNEFILQRFNGGVKFVRPDSSPIDNQSSIQTLSDILDLPNDVNIVNVNGETELMNELAVKRSGMQTLKDCLGKNVADVAKPETAHFIQEHQQKILQRKQLSITEYDFIRKDDVIVNCLLLSLPWYHHDNTIKGIMNLAIVSGRDVTPLSLASLIKLGLLNQPVNVHDFSQIHLSKRETECLQLLAKGKKSKEIGLALKLSPRTIDHYLENCMNKFSVSTRYELISKYLQSLQH